MENKAIIITGANGNVGSYFAEQFLKSGENLVLLVHELTHRIDPLLQKYPEQTLLVKADISDLVKLETNLNLSLEQSNWIPASLIHTVTVRSSDFQPLVNTDPVHWRNIVNVNLFGTYNILKVLIPHFIKYNYGKIVLFGSNVTRVGLPRGSAYSASKAAIANIGRSLSVEVADKGILINTISPGPIKIDDSQFSESYREFRMNYYKEKIRDIPLKRHASFADIFGICRFLVSEENTYITGEEFFVTGGRL